MGFPSILLGLCLLYLSAAQEYGQPGNSRIVGGQDATPGKWPWQVSILQNMHAYCGASIISEQWILSAAHCFYNTTPGSTYMALLGAHQLLNLSPDAVFAKVKNIILHPDYNGKGNLLGDIALIQLETPVDFTNFIMPIWLPTSSEKFSTETDCWVTGWGAIKNEVPLQHPLTLQEVKVSLISQSDCNRIYNHFPVRGLGKDAIKDSMICAGYPNSGKDSCQGDSGGPLVCQLQGRWIQAGIVSWGIGCASEIYPGVYTSVPYYSDWIKDVMEENMNNKPNSSNIPIQNVPTPVVPTQKLSNLVVTTQRLSSLIVPTQTVSDPVVSTQKLFSLVVPTQNVSTLGVSSQNVSNSVITTQTVSEPVVSTQKLSSLVVPTQNVSTLGVSSQNVSNSVITTQTVSEPIVSTQKLSSLVVPTQNVSTLGVSSQNVSNLVITTQTVSNPVASTQNVAIQNVSNLLVTMLIVLLLSIGLAII